MNWLKQCLAHLLDVDLPLGSAKALGSGTLSSLLSQLPFLYSDQNKIFQLRNLSFPHTVFQTCHSEPGVGRLSHCSVCKSQTLTHPHSLTCTIKNVVCFPLCEDREVGTGTFGSSQEMMEKWLKCI